MSTATVRDQEEIEAAMRVRYPSHFRQNLIINIGDQQKGVLGSLIEPWQEADFEALDQAFLWMAGYRRRPEKTRFWIQRSRGHSKTSDVAAELTWLLYGTRRNFKGIVAAEDKDQAKLVRDAMERIGEDNPWLTERLEYQKNVVRNKSTGANIEIISSDVNSAWGSTPDLVVLDEFTHWSSEKFWNIMFSSYGKKNGVLIICCNAGMGRDWKWRARETAQTAPRWHFSSHEGSKASWITQEVLDEQRSMLPPTEYSRLWENHWQETGGEFVTLPEARACCDPMLQYVNWGVEGWQYIAAIDYAEKFDYTCAAVGHVYGHKIIIDKMDTIVPHPGRPTRVSWVRNWMENVHDQFGGDVRFIIDKHQLLGVAEELMTLGFEIEEFEFAAGIGNYEMAVALRQCIIHQKILWYPGCGVIPDQPWGEDSLETELASLVVEQYNNGRRWRFNHLRDSTHHDDRSFVAGVICLHCAKGMRDGYEYFGITPPNAAGDFQWN